MRDPSALRDELLGWYDAYQRELPWRETAGTAPDPYRVWLSEVMLQQTGVGTVRKRYTAWLERFPTLKRLAEASADEVMKAWEGLGYYRRARNLHQAVREVHASYGGRVPDDPEAFRALPGVGRYTAGAVMSIAFGHAEPVVDGNVRRLFARWLDDPAPSDGTLWRLAEELVEAGGGARPGALNQALMELGATVCTPRAPRCDACPVSHACAARAAGTQAERPAPRRRPVLPHHDIATAVIEQDGRILLARRPSDGLLGGMWEFPGIPCRVNEAASAAAERGLPTSVGLTVRSGPEIAAVPHAFTHLRATYRAVRCRVTGGRARPLTCNAVAWCAPHEVSEYALPVAQRKVAALALSPLSCSDAGIAR